MTDKVKIRRILADPLCLVCPNFCHELIKGLGWICWCKDAKENIRTSVDPTPRELCATWGKVIRRSEPETPEQKEQAERLRQKEKNHATADKILASGHIDLDSIKDSVVRQFVFDGLEERHHAESERARIESEEKARREQEKMLRGLR
jgi:hypothetical protein